MYWPGLEPGSSKQYALNGRVERRLTKLLQALVQGWPELDLSRHKDAEFDEDNSEVVIPARGERRRDPLALTAYVWAEPDEDDEETYLLVGWYTRQRRPARTLAQEASRRRELRLSGLRLPSVEERSWYVRSFPMSQIEGLQGEEQLNRVKAFLRETFMAVEESGILETRLDRSKKESEG